MKKVVLLLFIFLVPFLSCKEEENTQMKEVMAIHDEVMPKMGEVGSLVAELRKKIDTDQGGMAEKKAMKNLQEANTAMMDWMRGFGDRFNFEEIHNNQTLNKEKQVWLDEEEKKVKIVAEKINSSIAEAKVLLGK